MLRTLLCCAIAGLLLAPSASRAEPIKLKLGFFSSDRSSTYAGAIKPFVDAVNAEGKGLVEIEVYFSGALGGALGRSQADQPRLILDGIADIAFVIPGQAPKLFYGNDVIELPGLFQDTREATLVHTRLAAAKVLNGYDQFHVIGAYGSEPESLHVHLPVTDLASLGGRKIRVNNSTEGLALDKLGMRQVLMPVNLVSEAISSGKIDGAAVPPAMLFEFGIGRVATNHYFLRTSSAPLLLLMNRQKFDGLPPKSQEVIRKYGGEWAAQRFIGVFTALNIEVMDKLKSEPRRSVVFPSQADLATAMAVFKEIAEEVVAKNHDRAIILRAVKAEVAKLRAE